MKQRIGLIGCGNMGSALLEGILQKGVSAPGSIFIFDIDPRKTARLGRALKVRRAASPAEIARKCRIIVLAVKPRQISEAAACLAPHLKRGQTLVSVLAGVRIATLRRYFGTSPSIVRVMPNLGARAQAGVSALSGRKRGALRRAELLFSACGETVLLPESRLNLVTAVSGSGPAYFFLLMELLEREARRGGVGPSAARLLAVQTALGAGWVAKKTRLSPKILRKMVTSKGGTTEAALKVFERSGFARIVARAVRSAVKRAKELEK